MKKKNVKLILSIISAVVLMLGVALAYNETGKIDTEKVHQAVDIVSDAIETYSMTDEEIKDLPSVEIIEQTEDQEKLQEQEVEDESFELQGEIAYEGDRATTWDVELGDYKGLTYYSQIDSRWSKKMYSSVGNSSQTIGSSGCRTNICKYDSNSL